MSGSGRVSSALLQCPLFYGRPIHALVPTCALRAYPAGQALFVPDDPATHLLVLVAGRVQTFATRAGGDRSRVAGYRAPDAVVDVGIFASNRTRRVGVEAVGDIEVVLVPHDALLRAAADDAVLTERLLTAIADAAGATTARPASGDVTERVLACLRRLAADFGVHQPDGSVLVALRLTHTDLATVIAASRPDVGKAIKELEAAGHLERLDEYYLLTAESG